MSESWLRKQRWPARYRLCKPLQLAAASSGLMSRLSVGRASQRHTVATDRWRGLLPGAAFRPYRQRTHASITNRCCAKLYLIRP